jgi:hypothetical protein
MIEPEQFDEKPAGGGSGPTMCYPAVSRSRVLRWLMATPVNKGRKLAIKRIGAKTSKTDTITKPGASS